MPLGAFRLNSLGKFTVTAAAQVIRRKLGVTALGNAQISTSQSKFGGTSVTFDGTGDYLTVNSSSFAFGTGNFTIECWARVTTAKNQGIFHLANSYLPSSSSGVAAAIRTDAGNLGWVLYSSGAVTGTSPTPATNTWYHLAVVRNSGTTTYYVNGSSVTSKSDTTNYTASTFLAIGGYYSTSFLMVGQIDEFRVSNIARYTSNFTAPTAPHVNDDNTVLLLHMDGGETRNFFEDDNGVRAKTATRTNNYAIVATDQSKFGGASAYFDGQSRIDNPGNFTSTGDFTYECWVRRNTTVGSPTCIFAVGNEATGRQMLRNNGAYFQLEGFSTSGIDILQTTTTYATNTWYHLAVVRSGSTVTLYQNGTSIGSGSYSGTFGNSTNFYVGMDSAGSYPITGTWIDEIRISNIARYTSSFTAPTAPFTNDSNTLLLIHCDGSSGSYEFIDDNGDGRTSKGISAAGNAQISTAQSKFGGSSALFDGSGDYLTASPSSEFAFGTNDWTAEYWVRLTSTTAHVELDTRPVGSSSGNGICLYYNGSNLIYYTGGAARITGSALSTNTWYHIALVRSGNDHKLYIDGTQSGSTYTATNSITSVNPSLYIGANSDGPGGLGTTGYIDEVRISNIARYTANFTAPTEAFQNDANTLLLIHADGSNTSTTFIDDNGKKPS